MRLKIKVRFLSSGDKCWEKNQAESVEVYQGGEEISCSLKNSHQGHLIKMTFEKQTEK